MPSWSAPRVLAYVHGLLVLVVLVGGCFRGRPSTEAITPAPSPKLIVYGGRADRDAKLVDLAVTPDGRLAALACVNHSLFALRWKLDGTIAVERPLGQTCSGRLVLATNDDVIVADSICTGSPGPEPEGCVRVRRFDPSVTTARWTLMPKLSVLTTFARGPHDQVAIGGWRAKPYTQDPTTTDVHVVDGAGATVRSHELLATRTDLSSAAFVGSDVVITGIVDPADAKLTVDGTAHPVEGYHTPFAARLGATRWFTSFDDMRVELYMPPHLAIPDAHHAIVVGMARPARQGLPAVGYTGIDLVELAMRIDLATGTVAGGQHRKAGEFEEWIRAAVATHKTIAIVRPTARDTSSRKLACRDDEPCRYINGPEAYGNTLLPQVLRIQPDSLELGAPFTTTTGYALTDDDHLVYAATQRGLYLGGSLTGTMTIARRKIGTQQTRNAPCDKRTSSTGGAEFILASLPPDDPCTVDVTYASALFIARVD